MACTSRCCGFTTYCCGIQMGGRGENEKHKAQSEGEGGEPSLPLGSCFSFSPLPRASPFPLSLPFEHLLCRPVAALPLAQTIIPPDTQATFKRTFKYIDENHQLQKKFTFYLIAMLFRILLLLPRSSSTSLSCCNNVKADQ